MLFQEQKDQLNEGIAEFKLWSKLMLGITSFIALLSLVGMFTTKKVKNV